MEDRQVVLVITGRPTMTIASYLRVSTDTQCVSHQQNAVETWAKERGYKVSEIIYYRDEGISGALPKTKRPGFRALLDGVIAGKIKRVLVFETSRLSRDFLTYLEFLQTCQQNHCAVEVIGKGEQAFATSQDMLVASIHAFLGQAEREKISQRTKSGLANAKAKGIRLGRPPIEPGKEAKSGWRKEQDPNLVKQILDLAKMDVPYRKIASILNNAAGKTVVSPAKISRIVNAAKAS